MTYTSDMQLQALNLKPMHEMPIRHGFRCTVVDRQGRGAFALNSVDGRMMILRPNAGPVAQVKTDFIGWRAE